MFNWPRLQNRVADRILVRIIYSANVQKYQKRYTANIYRPNWRCSPQTEEHASSRVDEDEQKRCIRTVEIQCPNPPSGKSIYSFHKILTLRQKLGHQKWVIIIITRFESPNFCLF